MKRPSSTQLMILLAACLVTATAAAEWYSDTQSIMGTRVHAEIWQEDATVAERVLAEIMGEMRRVDGVFSTFLARIRHRYASWSRNEPDLVKSSALMIISSCRHGLRAPIAA